MTDFPEVQGDDNPVGTEVWHAWPENRGNPVFPRRAWGRRIKKKSLNSLNFFPLYIEPKNLTVTAVD